MDDEILRGEIDSLRYRLKTIEDTLDILTAKIERLENLFVKS